MTLDLQEFSSVDVPWGGGSGSPEADAFAGRTERLLPRDPTAPSRARRELRAVARSGLSVDELDTAALLVSELVTNAVIHSPVASEDPIVLRVVSERFRLRVEVVGSGGGFDPARPRPTGREGGGRGLVLVEGLASRWGAELLEEDDEGRFLVWFELDRPIHLTQR